MSDDAWLKVAQFLSSLNRENMKRKSYVRTLEYEKALKAWKLVELEWEEFLDALTMKQRKKVEDMKECMEDLSSAQEERAYTQGYVDCIQVLYHMGLLKENEGLRRMNTEL